MSDLLMDSGLDARQQGLARTIQTSAGALLGIIENVLDFSKIEAGRISVEELDFDLHQLTADIVQMFKPQARRKGLRLDLIVDPRVPFQLRGDSLHLRQILMNLLSNAVKFTEQGKVELRLGLMDAADRGGIKVRFEIEDTGIGIPIADQGRIFESFSQADSSITRRFGGTGLGTAIARELTHLLGGQIGLRSEVGRGTLFWVDLPLSTSLAAPADPAKSLVNTRVLVIGGDHAYARLRRYSMTGGSSPRAFPPVPAPSRNCWGRRPKAAITAAYSWWLAISICCPNNSRREYGPRPCSRIRGSCCWTLRGRSARRSPCARRDSRRF